MSVEILAIIVDPLPTNCHQCQLGKRIIDLDGRYQGWECSITGHTISDRELYYERPAKCPLKNKDQAFDWMFHEMPATKHIKDSIEKPFLHKGSEE